MATFDAVTLDEVKTALALDGTSEDEAISRLISSTTLEVERRLRTQFVIRSLVEYHEGGGKRVYPSRTPIATVTTIVDPALNAVLASQFAVRQQRWIEHWGNFPTAYTTAGQATDWTVTYTAGWFASTAVVAQDIKAEIIRAVAALRESPAAGVTSVSVGDLSIGYAGGQAPTSPSIDGAVASLCAYQGPLL